MRRALLLAALVLAAGVPPARAEIAVLDNGMTLKVEHRRAEADGFVLVLQGGGEITIPARMVRGFVPDEIVEEVAAAVSTPAGSDIRAAAAAAAQRHGLDPELVLAVVAVESNFKPDAVSPKGAQGLMQLMPGTAREMGVADPLDPAANLDGGAKYLQSLIERYDGNVEKALAAYNAGPTAVERHNGVPPYKETQQYVKKVLKKYGKKS